MYELRQSIRQVALIMWPHSWALPVSAILGTLMTISEGVGIALLLPLLESFARGSSPISVPFAAVFLRALHLSEQPRTEHLLTIVISAIVIRALLAWGNAVFVSWVNLSIGHSLRLRLFDELTRVDQRFLHFQGTGRLFNSLATESWRAGEAIGTLMGLLVSACTVLIFTTIMLLISWRTTLVVALVFSLIAVVVHFATRRIKQVGNNVVESNRRLSELMVDVLSGMPAIQALNLALHMRNAFAVYSGEVRHGYHRMERLNSFMSPLSEICYAIVFAVILMTSTAGGSDIGRVITFLMVLVRLQPHVKQLFYMHGVLLGSMGAIQDVAETLSPAPGKRYIQTGERPAPPLSSGIRFENVSFAYGSDGKYALKNVSIQIPRGKMVALLGRSGAGKSSLVNLLLRLYDVTGGRILVDGVALPELDLQSWRRRITVVPQDVYVFSETVRNNISVGADVSGDAEILAAVRTAQAEEFILQLSDGLDTKLGENGVNLSGGQRQRLALARALIRDADVIVLDEATSWVDNISDTLIQKMIQSLRRSKTLIVITHRLHTVRTADHVIVLENGEVVEQGSPEDLLTKNGLYARLADDENTTSRWNSAL